MGHGLLSGITAVQAFYVISGFLITMVLNERQQYRNSPSFYVSRYFRLWPAYLVVLVATLTILYSGESACTRSDAAVNDNVHRLLKL